MKKTNGVRRSQLAPIFFIGVLSILVYSTVVAQSDGTNVPGMGMARTSVISSRSLDAVGINPANLGFSTGKTVTISLFPLGVHVGSNFLDYGLYTSYFTGVDTDSGRVGKYLTDADKNTILNAFPGSVGTVFADVQVRLFGVAIEVPVGTFALNITDRADAFANIPRDYMDFILHGNPPGTVRDFGQTDAKATWTREYALSYGLSLQRLKFTKTLEAGISVKLIHGFGYFGIDNFNSSLATSQNGTLTGTIHFAAKAAGADFFQNNDSQNNNSQNNGPQNNGPQNNGPQNNNSQNHNSGSSFSPFPAPAGVGYGVDLGVSAHLTDYLYTGLSLTDFGTMHWTRNAETKTIDTTMVVDSPIGTGQNDAVQNTMKGNKRSVDGFYSTLPTQIHAGAGLQLDRFPGIFSFPGEMLIELDYTQGFQNTPGSTRAPRFSLGVEYIPLSWLPIRTGVSVGGTDKFNVAFGFGLHFGGFDFDIATENVSLLLAPKSFSYGSLALGMKVKI